VSTLIRTAALGLLAGYLAGAACGAPESDRSGALEDWSMSAHDCWENYVGGALDAGAPDSEGWPPECADYLDRLLHGPCAEALSRVCGDDHACQATPACAAVGLMAEFDDGRERCQAALDDPSHYPDCHALTDCDVLVTRTCGESVDAGPLPCQGQPACGQALLLQADAAASHVYTVCSQALQEGSLYPRCGG
jgi:hypothetical protein